MIVFSSLFLLEFYFKFHFSFTLVFFFFSFILVLSNLINLEIKYCKDATWIITYFINTETLDWQWDLKNFIVIFNELFLMTIFFRNIYKLQSVIYWQK